MTTLTQGPQELFSGVLYKVGGKVKTWNRRFFSLKSDYCLYYYKDTSKGALGTITLRDPKFKVRRGEASDISWPKQAKLDCTMAVVTSHRTYCVYCNYSHEIDEWIHMLTKAREGVVSEGTSGPKSSCSQVKVSESEDGEPTDKARLLSSSQQQPENYEQVYEMASEEATKNLYEAPAGETEPVYALASAAEDQEQQLYDDMLPKLSSTQEKISDSAEPNVSQAAEPYYIDIDTEKEQPLYEDMMLPPATSNLTSQESPIPSRETTPVSPPTPYKTDTSPSLFAPSLPPRNNMSSSLPPRGNTPPPQDIGPSPSPMIDNTFPPGDNMMDTPPSQDTSPLPPLPPRMDTPPPQDMSSSLPPRMDTPPPQDMSSSPPLTQRMDTPPPQNMSSSVETFDEKALPPARVDTPPPKVEIPATDSALYDEVPPSNTNATKKPSPVPRRRSFSPQAANAANPPVAKPRPRDSMKQPRAVEAADDGMADTSEQGLVLFKLQKQKLDDVANEKQTESLHLMQDVVSDPTLSTTKKAVFAETLREVEHERLLASEERFRWERERKKLEEERRMFEEEKRRLQEEMEQARLQIQ